MKHSKLRRAAAALLALALVLGAGGVLLAASEAKAAKPASLPVKAETKTGVTVYANAKASIDASNLAEGYLLVTYTGGRNVKIKVQITKEGGVTYTYNLNNQGGTETFPLTEGDGKYTVKVFENTTGTKYAVAHSAAVELKLRNDFLPFLYPNQFVDYNAKSAVVSKAAEIVSAAGRRRTCPGCRRCLISLPRTFPMIMSWPRRCRAVICQWWTVCWRERRGSASIMPR